MATGRSRTTQAYRGTAQPRTAVPAPPSRPGQWDPWYSWGPRYYSGPWSYYGYWPYYGPVAYSPWVFGGAAAWGAYGWDPYFYDPYGYVGVPPVYWASSGDRGDRDTREPSGSLRLRVNPDRARVYVDGALAGVANEFSGLSDHLTLPEGRHQIELRADGYEVFTKEVDVKAGRTQTERVKLQKQ